MDGAAVEAVVEEPQVFTEPQDPIESERSLSHGLLALGYGPVVLHGVTFRLGSIMPRSG
jgi:hypothetical protein